MTRLAVIGNPVAHSRSPDIHAAFALQAGIDIRYVRILAPLDGFRETVENFVAEGGRGFNVTVPFKREAFAMCDDVADAARQSEAVNTVSVGEGGRLCGYSTDGGGLVRDLRSNLGWKLAGKRILILGAGGAVSAVLPSLIAEQPVAIDVCNRTHSRARELASRHGGIVSAIEYNQLGGAYDIVISGTSAGLSASRVELPQSIIGKRTRCYDMIYSGTTTPFNQWALSAGCDECNDGLGMLVEQAALAFHIWFDFEPDTRNVIRALRAALQSED